MRARVGAARVGHLATVRPDGRPHVVVCCFALDGDTAYSAVDGKPKTTTDLQRLRNVAAHPAASLLVDRYDDDWTRLWWVRLDGRARTLDGDADADEQRRAIDLLVAKYEQYRSDPPVGPVLALDAEAWRAWPR